MAIGSLTNKADTIRPTITDYALDVIELMKTWHSGCDELRLRLATPDTYTSVSVARHEGRGEGVAIIFRCDLKCLVITLPRFASFESVCVRLRTRHGPVVLLNIYRPGSSRPQSAFFEELQCLKHW